MKKSCLSLLAVLISATSLPALAKGADKIPLPVHVGGRVLLEQQANQTTYTYSWPGIYFAAEIYRAIAGCAFQR
jgi:hypothetical protein